jgi:hypothetical protein
VSGGFDDFWNSRRIVNGFNAGNVSWDMIKQILDVRRRRRYLALPARGQRELATSGRAGCRRSPALSRN